MHEGIENEFSEFRFWNPPCFLHLCNGFFVLPYATMSISYEKEQQELKESIPILEEYLSTEMDKTENLQRFIDKVKRITEIKEPTPELIHEFIEKIVISSPRYFDGKRYQIVDIYYNRIGIIRGLTPEDMEEVFERELEQKQKEKTA